MTITLPPQRRDVLVHRLGDELLVHRPGTEDLHALGATASRVWDLCDGSTTAAAAASSLGLPEEDVRAAVEVLAGLDLLEMPAGLDRRRVLQGALVGAGLVTTMALPTAAMAASDPGAPPPQQFEDKTFTHDFGTQGASAAVPAGATGVVVTASGAPGGGRLGGPGALATFALPDGGSSGYAVSAGIAAVPGGAGGGSAAGSGGNGGAATTVTVGGQTWVLAGGGGAGGSGTLATTGGHGGSADADRAGSAPEADTLGGKGGAGGVEGAQGPGAAGSSPTAGVGGGGGGGGGGAAAGLGGSAGVPSTQDLGVVGAGGGGGAGASRVPAGVTLRPSSAAGASLSYVLRVLKA